MQTQYISFRKLVLVVLAFVLIIFGFIYYASVIGIIVRVWVAFVPFLAGIILAFVLNIPMSLIEPRLFKHNPTSRYARPISLLLSIILFLAMAAFVVMLIAPQLIESILQLARALPEYWTLAQKSLEPLLEEYPVLREISDTIRGMIPTISRNITAYIRANIQTYINTSATHVQNVLTAFSRSLVSIVMAILVLLYKESLFRSMHDVLHAYFPLKTYKYIRKVGKVSHRVFTIFITENCLEAVVFGFLCYVVLRLFGFQFTLLIATIIVLCSFVPIVGKSVGSTTNFLLILLTQGYQKALLFFVIFYLVNQLMIIVVNPRIIGRRLGLPPVWLFMITTLAVQVFGMMGIILCIPISGVLYLLISMDVRRRLRAKDIPAATLSGESILEEAERME